MTKLPADEAVYFADAVHPRSTRPNQLSAGCVRARTRRSKPPQVAAGSTSMGAVCLENFDVPFVEPVTVDGDSAVQLLAKIEANNPSKSLVHVIWDNAAYHRCAAVKKWLSRPKCRIHLIQLPAYCPHLNPIERLWPSCMPMSRTTASISLKSSSLTPYCTSCEIQFPKNGQISEVRSQRTFASSLTKTFGFWSEGSI